MVSDLDFSGPEHKNKMIKVNKIEPQTVEHFDPEGNSLGFLNEYENTDLRVQIAEQKVLGYYLMFNGKKFDINIEGRIKAWPDDLYGVMDKLLCRII